MSITFGGLATGIDTASLIDGLVNAEKAGAAPYTKQQTNLSAQKTIVGNLSTALGALGSLADDWNVGSTELSPRTATASDSHVTVAVSSAAAAVTHAVRVEQTATSQVTTSNTFASDTAGIAGAGTLTLGSATVNYTSGDSLSAIAAKINNAKAGVSASVLNDGTTYRLLVQATSSGTAGAVAMTDTGSLNLADPANVKIAAHDAIVDIDGVKVTRSKNVIDDALPGVTLTAVSAQAAADPDTTVAVALDTSSLTTKLTSFVNSFNVIAAGLNAQLSYSGDGSTPQAANTLFGDSTLRQLQGQLTTLMTSKYGGHTLADLGLSRDKSGILSLDQTKLTSALANNPSLVSETFTTGGFGAAVKSLTDLYDRAGDGILAVKSTSMASQIQLYQDQIDAINNRADTMRTQLEDQFSKLESTVSALKNQSSYISKLFG